jgi:hypothetical protein
MSSTSQPAELQNDPAPNAGERPTDPKAILQQLERILTSTVFRNSKRCAMLLRFAVTETLAGRADTLKERTIGMAVFGRAATYDTSEDPVVRISAAEVRKRIAQFYHVSGHEEEIRIELPTGSYVPQFLAAAGAKFREARAPDVSTLLPSNASSEVAKGRNLARTGIAAAILAIVMLGGLAYRALSVSAEQRNPLNAFWAPITSTRSVILAGGDPVLPAAAELPSFGQVNQGEQVAFADAAAMARVAALLGARGVQLEIRRAGGLSLRDLRRSPAVLIGEMSNTWTRELEGEQGLRYVFTWDLTKPAVELNDRQTGKPLWVLALNTPYASLKEDRAIITRMIDPSTEHAVLILAGCGRDGTTAASEFVSDPKYLNELAAHAPKGWSTRNLQVVIATDLIRGNSGPPRIVATHYW